MDKTELTTRLKDIESIKNSSKPEYLDKNVELLVDKIENCNTEIKSVIEKWLFSNIETFHFISDSIRFFEHFLLSKKLIVTLLITTLISIHYIVFLNHYS